MVSQLHHQFPLAIVESVHRPIVRVVTLTDNRVPELGSGAVLLADGELLSQPILGGRAIALIRQTRSSATQASKGATLKSACLHHFSLHDGENKGGHVSRINFARKPESRPLYASGDLPFPAIKFLRNLFAGPRQDVPCYQRQLPDGTTEGATGIDQILAVIFEHAKMSHHQPHRPFDNLPVPC